jgi:hypothetical protein
MEYFTWHSFLPIYVQQEELRFSKNFYFILRMNVIKIFEKFPSKGTLTACPLSC